jgi:hypothetical protein
MKDENRAVSPDRRYMLSYSSGGDLTIADLASGEPLLFLPGFAPVSLLRAVFSRDMRKILLLYEDGCVGVFSMPPWKAKADCCTSDIVQYLDLRYEFDEGVYRVRRPGFPARQRN